ncbi:MAG: hypothetical protein DCC58_01135 [Chloroflexi bacterium]|nr:MAG: hypothetical protein DCC58_01135 [Chloroflexota bacterium]
MIAEPPLATPTITTLEMESAIDMEIDRIVQRLTRGFEIIESAREAGERVDDWEDTWIRLLQRYELLMKRKGA